MAGLRRLALGNIVSSKTVFFCCDMQERFRLAIQHFKDIVICADRLVRADLESHHFIVLKSLVFAIIYSGQVGYETQGPSPSFRAESRAVGYETQGPSPSSRAESRARLFEFPIFSKLRFGLCFYQVQETLKRTELP